MQYFEGSYWVSCLNRFFNYKEWARFCDQMRCATDKAVARYKEFEFNMCDCCLNPIRYNYRGSNYQIQVCVAETPRGWVSGGDWHFSGENSHGGGYGVAYDDKNVSSTKEGARVMFLRNMLKWKSLNEHEKDIIKRLAFEGAQMELF